MLNSAVQKNNESRHGNKHDINKNEPKRKPTNEHQKSEKAVPASL